MIGNVTSLSGTVHAAIDHARRSHQSCVVSKIEELNRIQPLDFYQHAGRRYSGQRCYWSDSSGELQLVGAGSAATISTQQEDAAVQVRQAQARLFRNAYTLGTQRVAGTGPIFLGGFSFDSKKERAEMWQDFGSAYFILPEFLLTVRHGRCYLTHTILCRPNDDVAERVGALEAQPHERFDNVLHAEPGAHDQQLLDQNDQDQDTWCRLVAEAVQTMQETPMKKIVLARARSLIYQRKLSRHALLRVLSEQQKGTCIFCLEKGSAAFIGATPERLIKKSGRSIESACLAGSAARGKTQQEDDEFGKWLLNDGKNLKEHQYVVESVRDALNALCTSLSIPKQPVLMKNKNIQHLYTPVKGRCKSATSLIDLVARLHPTPALGGLPKKDAMAWIRTHEAMDRGFYASPIGWVDSGDHGEFDVGIRAALLRGNEAVLFAGCGVLADSDPIQEYQETDVKFQPMQHALMRGTL
ncbi:isochorismate synthase [Sporolactobacillus terrae]|uniref:isochorismate synthase n=1 Tax=Sporolactobacillus terrae TaxID=269673 RepID=UPI000687E755|nr:isochorismate synthase [Sporolactobacillus terrae]